MYRIFSRSYFHLSVLFGDMKMIGDLNDIDVAALPIGDNFTIRLEDATVAATWLQAKIYIPIHYNTFELIQQDPNQWKKMMAEKNLEVVVLGTGESFSLEEENFKQKVDV